MVKNYYKHIGLCLLTLLGTCNNAFGMISWARMVASRMPRFTQFQTPRLQSLALTRHVTNPTLNRAFRAPALTGTPRTFTAPGLSASLAAAAYRPTAIAQFSTDSKNQSGSDQSQWARQSSSSALRNGQQPSMIWRILAAFGIGSVVGAYLNDDTLEKYSLLINGIDNAGSEASFLKKAIIADNYYVVRACLKAGIPADSSHLYLTNKPAIAQMLVKKGVAFDSQRAEIAYKSAVKQNNFDLLRIFKTAGAQFSTVNNGIICRPNQKTDPRIIETQIKDGANPNNDCGCLDDYYSSSHVPCIKPQDNKPLSWAIYAGNRRVAEVLLAHGAQRTDSDLVGMTMQNFSGEDRKALLDQLSKIGVKASWDHLSNAVKTRNSGDIELLSRYVDTGDKSSDEIDLAPVTTPN